MTTILSSSLGDHTVLRGYYNGSTEQRLTSIGVFRQRGFDGHVVEGISKDRKFRPKP